MNNKNKLSLKNIDEEIDSMLFDTPQFEQDLVTLFKKINKLQFKTTRRKYLYLLAAKLSQGDLYATLVTDHNSYDFMEKLSDHQICEGAAKEMYERELYEQELNRKSNSKIPKV